MFFENFPWPYEALQLSLRMYPFDGSGSFFLQPGKMEERIEQILTAVFASPFSCEEHEGGILTYTLVGKRRVFAELNFRQYPHATSFGILQHPRLHGQEMRRFINKLYPEEILLCTTYGSPDLHFNFLRYNKEGKLTVTHSPESLRHFAIRLPPYAWSNMGDYQWKRVATPALSWKNWDSFSIAGIPIRDRYDEGADWFE